MNRPQKNPPEPKPRGEISYNLLLAIYNYAANNRGVSIRRQGNGVKVIFTKTLNTQPAKMAVKLTQVIGNPADSFLGEDLITLDYVLEDNLK